MVLRRQGYYKEMPHGEETDPSIMDYINKNKENINLICEYLKNGYVLAACGAVVNDVICPENGVIGTPDDVTDGKWIWPADLAYYVQNYNLKLEDEFINYMIEKSWSIPKDIVIDEDEIEVI